MEKIDLWCIKRCWGNFTFDYVYSESVDYFIMVRGVWVSSGKRLLIISVYAPQDLSEKKMLWDYLSFVIGNWDGEVVIMGDFNEVRDISERFGSIFNKYGAEAFNSFFVNAGLLEVPFRFEKPNKSRILLERDFVKKISLEQNDDLERVVSNEEIKRADIIGNDVVDAVKWFFPWRDLERRISKRRLSVPIDLSITLALATSKFTVTSRSLQVYLFAIRLDPNVPNMTGPILLVVPHQRSLQIKDGEDVERYISAKLPDPAVDPEGYKVVSEMMVHGPFGLANSSVMCMSMTEEAVRKNSPKKYNDETFFDKDGYVHYRRRNMGIYANKRQDIQTANKRILPTYRTACEALDSVRLWEMFWHKMADDIPIRVSKLLNIQNIHINHPDLEGYLLDDLINRHLMEVKNYKRDLLMEENRVCVSKLNFNQKEIYDLIINAFASERQKIILIYGHGGTRKTFLWKMIISGLRSEGFPPHRLKLKVKALVMLLRNVNLEGGLCKAMASSGIASLLLPSRRTAHSRFKLPLELMDESLYNEEGISKLIDFIYDKDALRAPIAEALLPKAIFCLKNETTDIINTQVLDMIERESTVYVSSDEAIPVANGGGKTEMLYMLTWQAGYVTVQE
uniref:ATP-dependent DNA helicase n=1 Tax=Tanacetum cinerariifolium TaxID=118510 RepID=A0A699GKP1_TANCI|nr:DNA helicase [Tanacetum cinerariifolium]